MTGGTSRECSALRSLPSAGWTRRSLSAVRRSIITPARCAACTIKPLPMPSQSSCAARAAPFMTSRWTCDGLAQLPAVLRGPAQRRQRRCPVPPHRLRTWLPDAADDSEIYYQISVPYEAASARGVRWDDPAFAIAWPQPPARYVPSSGMPPTRITGHEPRPDHGGDRLHRVPDTGAVAGGRVRRPCGHVPRRRCRGAAGGPLGAGELTQPALNCQDADAIG